MLWEVVAKTVVVHTLTYFVVGLLAFWVFSYGARLADVAGASSLRPSTDPLVRAGVLFQPIRGLMFGLVFYLLRGIVFDQHDGWLIMWIVLVMVGIFSTFAPAPSSVEGFIYMKADSTRNWGGLVEILTQSFLLSALTFYWVKHPEDSWLSWFLAALFIVALVLPGLGILASRAGARRRGA